MAGFIIIPLSLLIQGAEMVAQKITPILAVAAPTVGDGVEGERRPAAAGHASIEDIPAHPFDVCPSAAPIIRWQLVVGDVAAGMAVNDAVTTVTTVDVGPTAERQAPFSLEQLVNAGGEQTGIAAS